MSTTAAASFCFFLAVIVQAVFAQVPDAGPCPSNIKTVENFQVDSYQGYWFEYSKYPFIFELDGKCIYAKYGAAENNTVSVYNFNINRFTRKESDIRGEATIVAPAKLKVRFDNMPAFTGGANYWVLDTDYDKYSVVYSCTDVLGLLNAKVVWILTRDREPSPEIVEKARRVITEQGLSLKPLQKTDQTDCPQIK